jgi:uncharacterized protein (DUF1810 family)
VPVGDPFDLDRFVSAQDHADTYRHALAELRDGRKRTHWMWFVFPQIRGLGSSPTARTYAISSLEEAVAYLRHPVLGRRLVECAEALLASQATEAAAVLGSIDGQKLRSSMTLFARADPDQAVFPQVLDRFFDGQFDPATDARL